MKVKSALLLTLFLTAFSGNAFGQDNAADMTSAIDRYLQTVPTQDMMDEIVEGVSQNIPEQEREEFLTTFGKLIDPNFIEKVTRESMAQVFSVDEVNALTDFYASANGRSVMEKFPQYMQIAMPKILQEVQRAMQELQKSQ